VPAVVRSTTQTGVGKKGTEKQLEESSQGQRLFLLGGLSRGKVRTLTVSMGAAYMLKQGMLIATTILGPQG
jgi:hypothetical protein